MFRAVSCFCVFFFKQKTAYEMRISDWSSDVCSADLLYCDRPDSLRRRACRTVLDELFSCLTAWLAPILCFTAEEAWWTRGTGKEASVHLRTFPAVPAEWLDPALAAKWAKVREVRRVVTGALEVERAAKRIGRSEEHTSELQSLMRISYAVFCLKKKREEAH